MKGIKLRKTADKMVLFAKIKNVASCKKRWLKTSMPLMCFKVSI